MYKIIGADGREYGPVTFEQLQQWIREGRANAQTKIQPEGSADWKALAELPEFAASFDGGTTPSSPPIHVTPTTAAGSASIREIDIGNCISRGWNLVKNHPGGLISTFFVTSLLLGGVGTLIRLGVNLAIHGGIQSGDPAREFPEILKMWPGVLLGSAWNLLVTGPLMGGLYNYYLKVMRGQPVSFGDAFKGFGSVFGQLLLGGAVVGILGTLGFFCCLIPGIYLMVAWMFVMPLIIDKGMKFSDAMELSRKTVTAQWWSLFALLIVAGLVSTCGVILCCVGILFTAPIGIAAIMYAYEDLFGSTTPSSTV